LEFLLSYDHTNRRLIFRKTATLSAGLCRTNSNWSFEWISTLRYSLWSLRCFTSYLDKRKK